MLKLNFKPFTKKIDSFPKPKKDYEIIEEERVIESRLPIYLEGDLEKVKQAPFGITLQDEFEDFFSPTYSSGPFYHYQIDNMLLLKNRIYFDDYEYQLNPLEKAVRYYQSKDLDEIENISFTSMRISNVFFGHWLREELMLIDYLQGKSEILSSSYITPQKKDIVDFFNLKFIVSQYAKIKHADMYDGWQHSKIYIDILKKYKEKIASTMEASDSEMPHIVYLRRGGSATNRALKNENELINTLRKSYKVTDFVAESTPIQELYPKIYSADIILSIEGSQMAHAIIAGRFGATLLCIQPPERFYNPFKNYCADVGLKYAILVAEPGKDKASFFVDIKRLSYLLKKVVDSE